jgi:hypothetical protein
MGEISTLKSGLFIIIFLIGIAMTWNIPQFLTPPFYDILWIPNYPVYMPPLPVKSMSQKQECLRKCVYVSVVSKDPKA